MNRPARSSRRLLSALYHSLWQGIDLVVPPSCGGCGRVGYRWCLQCQASVRRPPAPLCEKCGKSIVGAVRTCGECLSRRPLFTQLRSWSVFEGSIRHGLHGLKYRRDVGYAEALTGYLREFAAELAWPVDIVVPVPLGKRRLNERGYNQAGLLSWPLALALDLPYAADAMRRTRDTSTQVGLNPIDRRENVRGAFEANSTSVRGQGVLLLDDIATTGATLSSCAEALLAAGARDVFALTVSRALPGRDVDDRGPATVSRHPAERSQNDRQS